MAALCNNKFCGCGVFLFVLIVWVFFVTYKNLEFKTKSDECRRSVPNEPYEATVLNFTKTNLFVKYSENRTCYVSLTPKTVDHFNDTKLLIYVSDEGSCSLWQYSTWRCYETIRNFNFLFSGPVGIIILSTPLIIVATRCLKQTHEEESRLMSNPNV